MSEAGIGLTVVGSSVDPGLFVTSGSASLRRELGPVAWSALELLALGAEHTSSGTLIATLGVRELAQQLGVGRDATARAMGILREQGLISVAQSRAGGGRFDGTHDTPKRGQAPTLFDPDDSARKQRESSRHSDSKSDRFKVPRKLHELAFTRMRARGDTGVTSC